MKLLDKLEYDESSPSCLRWNQFAAKGVIGKPITYRNTYGYFSVSYQRKGYGAHRIIWEIHHGKIPEGMQIDHIDGDRSNNKIDNLRMVTPAQNNWNRVFVKRNLPRGVTELKNGGYLGGIRFQGERFRKWFKTVEEASEWVVSMRNKLHGDFAMHTSTRTKVTG